VTAIPTPVPLIPSPPEAVNIVLLGTDTSAGNGAWRTDTIIVVSVDPIGPSVSMLSIPRDLFVYIPGYRMQRINVADGWGERVKYPGGGAGLIKQTLEYNLGIRVHYYARVNFDGFKKIVDTLGGIDVVVDCPLNDTFPDPDAPEGKTDIDLAPGVHHMDGKLALWYARSRWNTSDFDRARRQQRVLRAIWAKVRDLGLLGKLPDLWDDLQQTVQTDLTLENLLWLASIGAQLDTETAIKSRFIDTRSGALKSWTTPEGAYVLLPIYDKLSPLVAEALAPPASNRAFQGWARVEVLNGTTWQDWGILAADRLLWEGFEVAGIGEAEEKNVQRTRIVDYTTSPKGSPLGRLMRLFRVRQEDVIARPGERDDVDFQIIVGYNYNPCYRAWGAPTPTPTPSPTPTLRPAVMP